jgi:hypothetical protein
MVSFAARYLYPEERTPVTLWIGGWVSPTAGLDDMEKILDPIRTQTPTPSVVQPVASRYTDRSRLRYKPYTT